MGICTTGVIPYPTSKPEKDYRDINYFKELNYECAKLNNLGRRYLKTLPFMPSTKVRDLLYKELEEDEVNFRQVAGDSITDAMLDGWYPFYPPESGSLFNLLSYAMIADEARARNLLERVQGRETEELKFPARVPKDFCLKGFNPDYWKLSKEGK